MSNTQDPQPGVKLVGDHVSMPLSTFEVAIGECVRLGIQLATARVNGECDRLLEIGKPTPTITTWGTQAIKDEIRKRVTLIRGALPMEDPWGLDEEEAITVATPILLKVGTSLPPSPSPPKRARPPRVVAVACPHPGCTLNVFFHGDKNGVEYWFCQEHGQFIREKKNG